MLLHAVKREPHSFIVTDGRPLNVPMSPVSQPRLVRDGGIGRQGLAALPLGPVMALLQAPLDPELVFAEAD